MTEQVGAPPRGLPQVKSLSRGTRILRTLADRPMRPSDLSRELDAPWATIYRTVRGLTEEGMLQRDPDTGEYSVGPTLWALASSYIRDHAVLGVGLRHLEQLLPSIQGLLKLTERCDSEAVTLFAEQNPQVPAVRRIREQYRVPLHAVSFGQVLLAFESPEFVAAYLAEPLQRVSSRTVTDPDAMTTVLAQIREQGYAVSRAELQSDNGSIAVPVFRKDGSVAAAVSAVLPLQLIDDADVADQQRQLLMDTAVTLSESLGWRAYRDAAYRAGA
ncbi:IclR family transcriptional regulator [Blastococcus saxobsidens]|uniref:Transcriptional regulator, IclR family n=1 Tax=Blastococcus saxobsidens (strain DD2) TaxID=1146883 RepID=H6RQL1_BLASD|nr:IclR family transcriptional regulator [Blastococcus saxobsidens]CCG05379.1 Transcriptional regulator, IclR family [Blastococcus saxobsidens DD2]